MHLPASHLRPASIAAQRRPMLATRTPILESAIREGELSMKIRYAVATAGVALVLGCEANRDHVPPTDRSNTTQTTEPAAGDRVEPLTEQTPAIGETTSSENTLGDSTQSTDANP